MEMDKFQGHQSKINMIRLGLTWRRLNPVFRSAMPTKCSHGWMTQSAEYDGFYLKLDQEDKSRSNQFCLAFLWLSDAC